MSRLPQQALKWLIFSILISLIFRAPSVIQDGLSERAWHVGWWSWRIAGWLVRDIPQAIFVLWCGYRAAREFEWRLGLSIAITLTAINALLSYASHKALYEWTVQHRWLFTW